MATFLAVLPCPPRESADVMYQVYMARFFSTVATSLAVPAIFILIILVGDG